MIGPSTGAVAPLQQVQHQAQGFTLIELLITLAILGLLATLVLPVAQTGMQHMKEQDLRRALMEIRHGLDDYKRATEEGRVARLAGASGYPKDLDGLVKGEIDLLDPKHMKKLYLLRRLPRDPMQSDTAIDAAQSWGKRAYASEALDPQEGADVYDIYSMSTKTGLNGVPYAKW